MFDFSAAYKKFQDQKKLTDAAKKEREAAVKRTYDELFSRFGAFVEMSGARMQAARIANAVQITDHARTTLTVSMTDDGRFKTSSSSKNPSTGKDDLARTGLSDQELTEFIVAWAMNGPNF